MIKNLNADEKSLRQLLKIEFFTRSVLLAIVVLNYAECTYERVRKKRTAAASDI